MFEKLLGLRQVKSGSTDFATSKILYFFSVPIVEAEMRDGVNRPVIALKDGKRYLNVSIDLKMVEGNWRLCHVSVGLLYGEPSITQKTPLLRAEWQIVKDFAEHGHGQPHWHVYGSASVKEETAHQSFTDLVGSGEGFDEFLNTTVSRSDQEFAFEHFHYAMSADWHCTPSTGPFHQLENEASLLIWLEGCVKYINHELAHVDRKSGSRPTNA